MTNVVEAIEVPGNNHLMTSHAGEGVGRSSRTGSSCNRLRSRSPGDGRRPYGRAGVISAGGCGVMRCARSCRSRGCAVNGAYAPLRMQSNGPQQCGEQQPFHAHSLAEKRSWEGLSFGMVLRRYLALGIRYLIADSFRLGICVKSKYQVPTAKYLTTKYQPAVINSWSPRCYNLPP